jgi:hypothetical protein
LSRIDGVWLSIDGVFKHEPTSLFEYRVKEALANVDHLHAVLLFEQHNHSALVHLQVDVPAAMEHSL